MDRHGKESFVAKNDIHDKGSRQSCQEAKSGRPLHIQFVHAIFFLFIFQPCAFEQYFPKIDGEFSKYISLKCHKRDLVF